MAQGTMKKERTTRRENRRRPLLLGCCATLFVVVLLVEGREGKRLEPEIQNDGTTQPGPALATAAALCQLGAAGAG